MNEINGINFMYLQKKVDLCDALQNIDYHLYYALYPDLSNWMNGVRTKENAYLHYSKFGCQEGRIINLNTFYQRYPDFDFKFYISHNKLNINTEFYAVVSFFKTIQVNKNVKYFDTPVDKRLIITDAHMKSFTIDNVEANVLSTTNVKTLTLDSNLINVKSINIKEKLISPLLTDNILSSNIVTDCLNVNNMNGKVSNIIFANINNLNSESAQIDELYTPILNTDNVNTNIIYANTTIAKDIISSGITTLTTLNVDKKLIVKKIDANDLKANNASFNNLELSDLSLLNLDVESANINELNLLGNLELNESLIINKDLIVNGNIINKAEKLDLLFNLEIPNANIIWKDDAFNFINNNEIANIVVDNLTVNNVHYKNGYSLNDSLKITDSILSVKGNLGIEVTNSKSTKQWTFSNYDNNYLGLYRSSNTCFEELVGYFDHSAGSNKYGIFDFTGQHRSYCENFEELKKLSGYIVCSTGKYINLDGSKKPTIDDSLPIVRLANNKKEKSVFGVISSFEDINSAFREYNLGFIMSVLKKEDKISRLIINSVGEGAIWISNINGDLENGDYIVSSEIPGIGMKQDDDILRNYTVAKITCDCQFDLESENYECVEFTWNNTLYRKAFVGCTYHCG